MGYARKPYGATGYDSVPYNRMSYGMSVDTDGLVFYAPLLTSLEEVYGAVPTFTRADPGTYIGSDGLLNTAAANEPRFEYDVGGGARGYLSEGARTNAMVWSEEFENPLGWTMVRATVTADVTAAPDGATTADSVNEDGTAASTHRTLQGSITITAGATVAATVFAKPAARDFLKLQIRSNGANDGPEVYFDLLNGLVGTTVVNGTGTLVSASIELAPNGFWRCQVVGTILAADTLAQVNYFIADADGSDSFDGLSQQSLFMWGADLEEATSASSYILTQGSPATRAEDDLTYPLVKSGDGSFQAVVDTVGLGNAAIFIRLDDGTDANAIEFTKDAGDLNRFVITGQADIAGAAMVANAPRNLTGTFATNDVIFYQDGVEQGTDATAVIPATTTVRVGNNVAGTSPAFGHIHSVKIYDRALGAGEV